MFYKLSSQNKINETPKKGEYLISLIHTYLSQYNKIYSSCRANAVFVSALYLIHQTNMIMLTVKDKCE